MPLWSQGCKVCVHPPLTDEARIALEIGDLVNVTRWRKHWLFGEKIQNPDVVETARNGKQKKETAAKSSSKKRIRGWFPRQCAAEFFEDHDEESEEEFEASKLEKKKK